MKGSSVRYLLEEVKFLKSPSDVKIFIDKLAYAMPRKITALDHSGEVPPSLQIEPTNYCDVACIMCANPRNLRPKDYMEFDLFKKIIDDAAQIGVKRIRPFLNGEPMLHPNIIEMIRYIKSKGLALRFTTNGMLFNPENAEAILRSGVDSGDVVTFTILGYSKQVHEQIMKGANNETVVQNVVNFAKLRDKLRVNGPVIETMFYTMTDNEHEEEQYVEYWRGVVDHARVGGRISDTFAGKTENDETIPTRTRTCSNIWERMTIHWNGDVTICFQDVYAEWILGNLKEQSIKEVWNSEQLLDIKKIHKARQFDQFPFCAKCDVY